MTDNKQDFLVCDVCFNEKLILDVNLSKTCTVEKIVEGLWNDEKFRSAALSFLRTIQGGEDDKTEVSKCSLKSFHQLDRSILRAYVSVRFLPTWKWLELKDFIADFDNRKETTTVMDVFGHFCTKNHKPILRIVPKRETEADDQEVKTIIQELLQTKSLATLAATGCPLSKGMLSLIGQEKYSCTISYDKRDKFVHWLSRQDFNEEIITSQEKSPFQQLAPFKIAKSRVTFGPDGELSKLVNWFNENQRPGKELIEEYTNELNKTRRSKAKRMLTQESIAVWFKNRRAKAKKEESSILEPWERDIYNGEENLSKIITATKGESDNSVDKHKISTEHIIHNQIDGLVSTNTITNNAFEHKCDIKVENTNHDNNMVKKAGEHSMWIPGTMEGAVDKGSVNKVHSMENQTSNTITCNSQTMTGDQDSNTIKPEEMGTDRTTKILSSTPISDQEINCDKDEQTGKISARGTCGINFIRKETSGPVKSRNDTGNEMLHENIIALKMKRSRGVELNLCEITDNKNRKKHCVEVRNVQQ